MAEATENMGEGSHENDPWKLISNTEAIPRIPQLGFASPLEHTITPERYIQSLEKRLDKIKSKNPKDPTSKDMLKSLTQVKDDSLAHFITSGVCIGNLSDTVEEKDKVSVSDLQKRMYLDCKTAVTEEMVILVRDDILEKNLKTMDQAEKVAVTRSSS